MTKAEWWTADDVDQMLQFVRARASTRKLRLFAVAALRRARPVACSADQWERMLERGEWCAERTRGTIPDAPTQPNAVAAFQILTTENPVTAARIASAWATEQRGTFVGRVVYGRPEERPAQAALVRDIFGNPFRPVTFSPEWRTDTALAIALQMYEARDFAAMPILADALQDDGCDNEDLLRHCRDDGEHVRGCWVVDLVLGKE